MSELQKAVWVIEQGSYSDYRVVGVYTSQKAANRVCEAVNAAQTWEKAKVSEWPLDPCADEICQGLSLWRVLMLRDGSVEQVVHQGPPDSYDIGESGEPTIWKRSEAPAYRGKGIPDALQIKVWAEDANHAIKITNEKRGQMIAMGKW